MLELKRYRRVILGLAGHFTGTHQVDLLLNRLVVYIYGKQVAGQRCAIRIVSREISLRTVHGEVNRLPVGSGESPAFSGSGSGVLLIGGFRCLTVQHIDADSVARIPRFILRTGLHIDPAVHLERHPPVLLRQCPVAVPGASRQKACGST